MAYRTVSVSDLQPFERCRRLWYETRVRKLDDGNRWSRIGTACHVACECVTRAVLGADSRELYLVAREAVVDHATMTDMAPDEMHEALDIMDDATAPESGIYFGVPAGWKAAAEVTLALDADMRPVPPELFETGAAFTCRLDRLQWCEDAGVVEVWDWKTGQDWMSSEDVQLDAQARFYSLAALAHFPAAQVVTFRRVMLRLGYTATAKFVRGGRWESRIRDRMVRLRAGAREVLDAPDDVQERFGAWCGTCPVRGACELNTRLRLQGAVLTIGLDRGFAARQRDALRAAANEMDALLREDVRLHGGIALGDGTELGFHGQRSRALRWDREHTMAELRRHGMTEDQEREWFAPSERAMPGLVAAALERLFRVRGEREAAEERLLARATNFNFDVKETDE